MKILHCTDLHFSRDAINWIEANRASYDVVCLTGDFLDDREEATNSLAEQVMFFTNWFNKFKQPLFVCSGNHDYFKDSLSWLSNGSGLYGDGTRTLIDGVMFGCIGYEADNFEAYADCDVVLYHVPPINSSCAKSSGEDFGCSVIKAALKTSLSKAKYLLCGHVHRPVKHAIRLGSVIISNPGGVHKNNQASYASIEVINSNEVQP